MKMAQKSLSRAASVMVAFVLAAIATGVSAQSIEVKTEPYHADATLPFGAVPEKRGSVEAQAEPAPVVSDGASPVVTQEAVVNQAWEIHTSDATLSRALLRWARSAQRQFSYDAPEDLPAIAVKYEGDFMTALDALLRDTANGPYPLHGCAFKNLIRVLHISQSCDR